MPTFQYNASASAQSTTSKTLSANNTTANVPIFRITGNIQVLGLYGIVTTAIGSNHTGAYFRLNDQTAQTNITLNTVGTTLSSFVAGGFIGKLAAATSVAAAANANVGQFQDNTAGQAFTFYRFTVIAKNGANTDIEYSYATTNTPTTGVIQFFLMWQPLSADGAVTPQ